MKPTSPGRRHKIASTYSEITKKKPEKSLTTSLNKTGGRNHTGRITAFNRGGGNKRRYRIIDFKRPLSQPSNTILIGRAESASSNTRTVKSGTSWPLKA